MAMNIANRLQTLKAERDNAEGSAPHVIVDALAGTGKTFTLVMGVGRAVLPDRTLIKGAGFHFKASAEQGKIWRALAEEGFRTVNYIAFNRSIVEEFKVKWAWLAESLGRRDVSLGFSTCHQLGFRSVCKAYNLNWRNINQWKTRNLLENHLDQDIREVFKERPVYVQAVEELVRLCKVNLVEAEPEDLEALSAHYDVDLGADRSEIFETVPVVLEKARTELNEIDFEDQIWLPVVNDLPVHKTDLLLVDEGQDLNRCQQELAMKAGRRIVLVGDVNQAIYGFAGADVDSIPRMAKFLGETNRGVITIPLTVTRRCGKAIVREANQEVPEFKAHSSNGEGLVRETTDVAMREELKNSDMILCRVNAPLLGTAFQLLREGKRANIQGRDIGTGLKNLIKKSRRKTVDDFLDWLEDYYSTEAQRLNKRKNPSETALVALKDKVECLRVFCEGALSLKDVRKNIDSLFKGKECPKCKKSFDETQSTCKECEVDLIRPEGVLLSSIHRSKGLEAPRVFLLHPELVPHPMAKSDWAVRQEYNLRYVAKTRAIAELIYVRCEK